MTTGFSVIVFVINSISLKLSMRIDSLRFDKNNWTQLRRILEQTTPSKATPSAADNVASPLRCPCP